MKLTVYFNNDTEKRLVENKLNGWVYYNSFGGILNWDAMHDQCIIYGTAVCNKMVNRLQEIVTDVIVEHDNVTI